MTAANVCPQCGKALPSDGPQGQCPACLLKAALPGQSAVELAATGLDASSPSTAIAPEAGERLKYFGDYELLDEIARGGMGVVWKARQTSLKRDVALKMIRAGALAGPDEVQRFLREAEAAANLQHPNIVAIHEVGEHNGQHYFSMDYVAGRDLGALVKDGPLPPQIAARYVKIIAEAIHFAHQRGTLHRDLKPQNVLIDDADQPRITDFGLAKFIKNDSRLTQSGVVMGSPSYMPPEQAGGRQGDVGPASDVYSLGAMLYELLTGRPPFCGKTVLDTLRLVMEAEPVEPRRLLGTIPPDLETICLKCLEKSPSVRYPTARALAEELDRFLKCEPIQARPASAVRKSVSWARRHPRTLAALAALVMVALVFGVFYLVEDNAFLRAQRADPTLARVPGPRRASLKLWFFIDTVAGCAGIFTLLAIQLRRTGLSIKAFKEHFDPLTFTPPIRPLGERTRTLAIGAGLILIACAVTALVTAIQAYVWEREAEDALGMIFVTCAFSVVPIGCGLFILGTVIQDYRLIDYGTSSVSSRQLTAEQIEPIRRALEDGDWFTAVKRYREVVPGAGVKEPMDYVALFSASLRAQYPDKFASTAIRPLTPEQAAPICAALEAGDCQAALKHCREAFPEASKGEEYVYVLRLWEWLLAQNPDKFVPPPLSLANLNWKALLQCALIEALIVGVVWFVEPPSYPTAVVALFTYSMLFGMAQAAFARVKGWWKRLLLLVPALLVLVVSEIMLRSTEGSWRTVGPYFFGWTCGLVLMASGLAGEAGRGLRKKLGL